MDETRIAQVLSNLVNNALKFTSKGGRICVSVSCPSTHSSEVLIAVADTGRGIPCENLSRIFDRLYQVSDEDAASCKGLGLGLFICRELVSLHGGAIRVESELGKGSTFSITLPATQRGRVRVLIVDDEAEIRELLQLALEAENYSVSLATGGREAMEKVRREKPDVVITGLVMPVGAGHDLLEGIRQHCGNIPVLLYTGHSEEEMLPHVLRFPPVFFLSKPCETIRLLRVVRNAIRISTQVFGPELPEPAML